MIGHLPTKTKARKTPKAYQGGSWGRVQGGKYFPNNQSERELTDYIYAVASNLWLQGETSIERYCQPWRNAWEKGIEWGQEGNNVQTIQHHWGTGTAPLTLP